MAVFSTYTVTTFGAKFEFLKVLYPVSSPYNQFEPDVFKIFILTIQGTHLGPNGILLKHPVRC